MNEQHSLLVPLQKADYFKIVSEGLANSSQSPCTFWLNGVINAQKWHLTAGLLCNKPALIIASSELKAKEIYQDMYYFFNNSCYLYPSRDFLFYAADVKSVDITRQRLKILDKLKYSNSNTNGKTPPVVVLSSEALLDRMTPPEIFHNYKLHLEIGDITDSETVLEKLVQMGYERRDLTEGAGQFAMRGGILDIYPAVAGYCANNTILSLPEGQAFRVEFFDDEIDSIRVIDALTQRSIESNVTSFEVSPMRELVFDSTCRDSAILKIKEAYKEQHKILLSQNLKEEAQKLTEILEDVLERTLDSSVEAFLPFFYEKESNLLDYIPTDTIIFFDEPNAITIHMETIRTEFNESISNRLIAGRLLPEQSNVLLLWGQVLSKTEKFNRVLYSSKTGTLTDFNIKPLSVDVRTCMPLRHKSSDLAQDLSSWVNKGYSIVLLAGTRRQGLHLEKALKELELLAYFTDSLANGARELSTGVIIITRGTLSAGFEYPDIKLVVITDKELFTTQKSSKRRIRKSQNSEKISHFTDLRIGDYIVHDNHGIGIYRGIEQVTTDGLSRDYLKLEYSDGGNIYVQTAQMDLIQKYIGKEKTKLNKLGGMDWTKQKLKARKAVEILASDLIELYAKRQAMQAYRFGSDTVWQTEFESNFPYMETNDQLVAIEDVKRDMESTKVMDRLICGDVGYGKTEIAIRAAFKAVQDSKQVAYLVPTTILAQQHFQTFTERMKDYPISIGCLSRFRSKKEQQTTIKKLKEGSIDIVIGTHRLLSKDVNFHDLGLVVVDEEQRFGVGHKEKLKEMSNNVDVLTLTATPIPRTLHFSLTGIRDMSILDEPPEERQPIQTYVMEYNQEFVREAINRELARNGQVYYLHNRVQNIDEVASQVQALAPLARIAFAHGQMSERELENIMHDFIEKEIDVLVCTTIIETGLDISNVNTIIIQNADMMGLSQLYQLRGRVGRSSRLAYAYLMYRRDKVLQEDADKRLQTIREFTEFGAGFKIAMRDLEIRGAGNLLGAEQHGHMASVGYDMYCKMLAEVVAELQGTPIQITPETSIDISIDAHIPTYFISDELQKLEIYKKISLITNQPDYYDVQEEIEDRFGNMPSPVINLLDIALVKAKCKNLGILSITQKGINVIISFSAEAPVNLDKLTALLVKHPTKLLFTSTPHPYITLRNFKNDKTERAENILSDGGARQIKEISELLDNLSD